MYSHRARQVPDDETQARNRRLRTDVLRTTDVACKFMRVSGSGACHAAAGYVLGISALILFRSPSNIQRTLRSSNFRKSLDIENPGRRLPRHQGRVPRTHAGWPPKQGDRTGLNLSGRGAFPRHVLEAKKEACSRLFLVWTGTVSGQLDADCALAGAVLHVGFV